MINERDVFIAITCWSCLQIFLLTKVEQNRYQINKPVLINRNLLCAVVDILVFIVPLVNWYLYF